MAGYIAKYATKATESSAPAWTAAGTTPTTWTALTSCPPMSVSLSGPVGSWAASRSWKAQVAAWAHMLGFGGHWSTKSRRYSTTMTVLRRPGRLRQAPSSPRRHPPGRLGLARDDQAVTVVASWVYVAQAMRPRASAGWPSRPPRAHANSDGSPGRNYARWLHDQESQRMTDKLLTVEEAAGRLGTSLRFVRG